MDGDKLLYVNPILKDALKKLGLDTKEILEKICETGKLSNVEQISEWMKEVFVTSQEIHPEDHVLMQATFQGYVENAISKTINFDNSATEKDILDAYLLAYDSGCKGITVYRDGCRPFQVYHTGSKTNEERKENRATEETESPKKKEAAIRPDVISGETHKIRTGEGTMYVTVNHHAGKPFELFASIGKAGGNAAAKGEAVSRLVSLALRSGISVETVIDQLIGIESPSPVWHNGEQVLSTPDAIGKVLKKYLKESSPKQEEKNNQDKESDNGTPCPKCNTKLNYTEGCLSCHSCGYSKCS